MPSSLRTPKNRVAFLEMEGGEFTVEELFAITGFARCADCGCVIHSQTLVTLPGHRCAQRRALRRAAQEAS